MFGCKVIEETIQQYVRKERSAVLLVLSNFFPYRIHYVLAFVNFYFKKIQDMSFKYINASFYG